MESSQIDLKAEHRSAAIVSGAIIAGLFVYAGVVEFIRHRFAPFGGFEPTCLPDQARDIFYGLAFLEFLAIRVIRKVLLKQAQADGMTLVKKLKTTTLITFASAGSPAILGLILFLTKGLYQEFYALLLFSLLLMVVYFPRFDQWESWVRGTGKPY